MSELFVVKAVCTFAVAGVVALGIWLKSKSSTQRKAFVMVLCAVLFLTLSAESCDDSGSNKDWASGSSDVPVVRQAQDAYSGAVNGASAAYGQAVQGSVLGQACTNSKGCK